MERQHRSEVAMRDDGAVVCGLFVDIARKQVRGFFFGFDTLKDCAIE